MPTPVANPNVNTPSGAPATLTTPDNSNSNTPDADTPAGASIPKALVNNPAVPTQTMASQADNNKASVAPDHKWLHDAAVEMAGGPQYRTTYDANGNAIRTEVPVSPAHLGLAIALEVLRGGLAGGNAKDSIGAAQAGAQVADQQRAKVQQANQQQDAQAKDAQKYKMAVTETNLRTHLLAQQVGASDKAISQTLSDAYKPLTEGLMDGTIDMTNGASVSQPMFETDATASIKNGTNNITHDVLLPVGDPQPVMENGVQKTLNGVPLWGHNYIVVKNADKLQTQLTDDLKQKLQSIGYFRNSDGSAVNIGNPQWSFADLSKKMSEYAAVQAGEAMLNQHLGDAHEYLGTADKDIPKLNDLATEVRNDPAMRKAIQTFSRFGGTLPIDVILYHMNDVDPQGAAKIMSYMQLTPKMLGDMATARAKEEAEAKNTKETKNDATHYNTVLAQAGIDIAEVTKNADGKTYSYQGKPLNADQNEAVIGLTNPKALAESTKKRELQDTRDVQDSDINKAARTMVDDPYNIASIRAIASMKGDERLRLFNATTDYAKSQGKTFDQSAADRKAKMLDSYENGKQADNIQSYQTFVKHAGDLYSTVQSLDRPEGTPKWIDKPLTWLEQNASSDPAIGAYLAKFEPVRDEILTFLKNNHAALQMDAESMNKVLDPSQSPAYIKSVVKSLAQTGQYRLDSINSRFKHEFKKDFDGLYDDESRDALKTIGIAPLGVKPPNPADVVGSGTLNGQKVFKLKSGDTVYATGEKVQ
jgi:hypothetical protein